MKSVAVPPFLKNGDTIAIVSTARKIAPDELLPAVAAYEKEGFKVRLGKTIGRSFHQFAGSDNERLADFQEMIDDGEVKAIICARGGYGTSRIIDRLDFSRFEQKPKWIVGYSDVTVLHCHVVKNHGVATLHATMPLHMLKCDQDQESFDSLVAVLKGKIKNYDFDPHLLNRAGMASGELTGGNLSIIYNLTGTASEPDTDGKILFLEDLDEYLYHVDRMMVMLKRAGKLENLAGLLIGGMTGMNDNAVPFGQSAEEIIRAHVEDYTYPVAFGFPAGHGPRNLAMVMGMPSTLNVNNNGCSISFQS
ncbi:MAG: LD-carboxypeptidase [Bacteroidia bacterium]